MPDFFITGVLGLVLGFGVLLLIRVALNLLGSELHHFMQAIGTEFKESISGKKTVGAINFQGLCLLGVFGVIVIVAMTTQKVVGLASTFITPKKAAELSGYTNYMTLFYVMALVLVLSVTIVMVADRKRT